MFLSELVCHQLKRIDTGPRIVVTLSDEVSDYGIVEFYLLNFADLTHPHNDSFDVGFIYLYLQRDISQRSDRLGIEVITNKDDWPSQLKHFVILFSLFNFGVFSSVPHF